MKKLVRRIQKPEKRLLPAPLMDFEQKLLTRLEAARRRVAAASGESAPIEVVSPAGNAVASPAIAHRQAKLSPSDLMARLHRGREHARRENLLSQSGHPKSRDGVVSQDGLPAGGSR